MGNTQVTSLHPVQVGGDLKAPLAIRNESATTVYYRANPNVTATLSDGSLTEHQEVVVIQPTWVTTASGSGAIAVNPGVLYGWTPLTIAAPLETTASGGEEAAIKIEGSRVRLKGHLKVESGKELQAKELLAIVPANFRKSTLGVPVMHFPVVTNETVVGVLQVELSNGHVTLSVALVAGGEVYLDGITWTNE